MLDKQVRAGCTVWYVKNAYISSTQLSRSYVETALSLCALFWGCAVGSIMDVDSDMLYPYKCTTALRTSLFLSSVSMSTCIPQLLSIQSRSGQSAE